ncbi:hypothetical protein [Streptomyces chartreusis]
MTGVPVGTGPKRTVDDWDVPAELYIDARAARILPATPPTTAAMTLS